MIKKIRIELLYFLAILIVLAILQHSDLLTAPLERINTMTQKGNYFHPLLWSSIVYVIIGLIRLIVKYLFYLKNKVKA